MSLTPREIGTLVVVILKAQHLPNKRSFGKQAPYCVVTLNGEKKRTRAIKKGGQHPEWDDELRFTLYEDTEDMLERTASSNDGETPPPPPPKEAVKRKKRAKGGNKLLLSCYADEPKEPELIGETTVDLTEVLKKGETDDWFTLQNKDKFSGEVYIEMTFWSNEKPPEKKSKVRTMKANQQYGGPGSFVPSDSGSSVGDNHSIPPSLRSANSLAQLSLYNPQYDSQSTLRSQGTGTSMNELADEFGGLSVGPGSGHSISRRESFPPRGNVYQRTESVYSTISSSISHHSTGHVSESDSTYSYDPPQTPVARHHRHSIGEPSQSYAYQSPYDPNPPQSDYSPSRPLPQQEYNASMYSVPSTSSGFVSVPTPAPSGFMQPPNGVPAPSGFIAPMSHTPAPGMYPPHPSQTPGPFGYGPPQPPPMGYAPPPSVMGYHQAQPYPPYQQYPMPPSSAPPTMYPPGPPSMIPMPSHSAPPQQYPPGGPTPPQNTVPQYPGYAPSTPTPPGAPAPYNPSPPVHGSRPLPMPSTSNGPYPGTPPHPVMPTPPHGHSPTHPGPAQYNNLPAPAQNQSHPLPHPPGPPGNINVSAINAGPPPAASGFIPPPPPPPLRRQSGGLPPPLNHTGAQDTPNGQMQGAPQTRPPLPQPPGGNGSMLPLPPPPSIQNGQHGQFGQNVHNGQNIHNGQSGQNGSSGFQAPPPPPPLPQQKRHSSLSMSMPMPLPQPPSAPPRSVQPGEIYNQGLPLPPRPPAQVVYDSSTGFWTAPPSWD